MWQMHDENLTASNNHCLITRLRTKFSHAYMLSSVCIYAVPFVSIGASADRNFEV